MINLKYKGNKEGLMEYLENESLSICCGAGISIDGRCSACKDNCK